MAFASVEGKTAIITGAGAGINLCFAQLLLSKGCNVVIADLGLRPESQQVIDKYNQTANNTARVVFQQTDVRDWTQLARLFDVCDEEFGGADIVCPGAGVYEPSWSNFWIPPGTPLSGDSAFNHTYATLEINVTHPIRMTQLAIAHFLKHKRPGSIVHISSIAAQSSGILTPLYTTSKHAISGFVRTMGQLERPESNDVPRIRVTAVAPGVVRTPLWLDNPNKLKWMDEDKDCWILPEEIAEKMLELVMSEEYVGGTVLEVGKGQSRKVEVKHDPGPSGPGMTVSNNEQGIADVWAKLGTEGWGQISGN